MRPFSFALLVSLLVLCGGICLVSFTASQRKEDTIINNGILWRDWRTGRMMIHQASSHAIFNLREYPPQGIEVVPRDPDAITIFRVNSGNPTRLYTDIRSKGSILIINPAGVVVGPAGEIDLPPILSKSTLDSDQEIPWS